MPTRPTSPIPQNGLAHAAQKFKHQHSGKSRMRTSIEQHKTHSIKGITEVQATSHKPQTTNHKPQSSIHQKKKKKFLDSDIANPTDKKMGIVF
jgi:hypothetical protein